MGLGEVIDGWESGLIGMCVGEKRRLFIPAGLAYGESGGGTKETPGGTLVYDIELIHAEQGPRHPEVFDLMDTSKENFQFFLSTPHRWAIGDRCQCIDIH